MQDLYCTEPKNLHYHEFAERMEFLKYSKEGEEKMTDVIEEYAARKAEALVKEAAKKAAKEAAKKAEEKEQANRIEAAPVHSRIQPWAAQ